MASSFHKCCVVFLTMLGSNTFAQEPHTAQTVVIDAGHGGADTGGVWGDIRESMLNLSIAKRVQQKLKTKGVTVVMTRDKDVHISTRNRILLANQTANAVFLSIHFNATSDGRGVNGVETYFQKANSKKLAQEIHKQLSAKITVRDKIPKKQNTETLTKTDCPSVIIECGYMNDPAATNKAKAEEIENIVAEAIVAGVSTFISR